MTEPAVVKGTVGFEIRLPIEVAEMRSWSPERCAAFFDGVASAINAMGGDGSTIVKLPTPRGELAHIHAAYLLGALEKFVRERPALPLTKEMEHAKVHQARDLLVDVVRAHALECTRPNDCRDVLSLAAFMAHSLGIRSTSDLRPFRELLVQYEANFPGCTPLN